MGKILLYVTQAFISSTGLYLLKISKVGFNFYFFMGFILYAIGFLIWIYILKLNELSVAFPIASSLLIIGTQIIGVLFLRESFNSAKLVGLFLIIIGIIILYRG